ncbi:vitellin-degrading protease-like [Ostrinia furnacalis]|uniref:vitellin-degrading protease-like n=1 Tax=Ostrinia furnacalis TaxID=93504 RepID=UPI00103B54A9|nr:vitellin-degrading protease-like [Ostrinia furnacalis]
MWVAVALCLLVQYLSSEAKVAVLPMLRHNDGIVGGEDIDISEAPYQVSLQVKGRHYCEGTLVAKDIVITAAHCLNSYFHLFKCLIFRKVTKLNLKFLVAIYAQFPVSIEKLFCFSLDASIYQIRAGSSFSDRDGELYLVAKVLPHPKFDYEEFDSDIGIVWLSEPVEVSDKIATVEMKECVDEVPDGDIVQVTGWGWTEPIRSLAHNDLMLQRVLIPKIADSKCRDAYDHLFTENMLCAGLPEGGKNACFDSGGPLIHNGKLAGVVSFSRGCARPDYPAVYAKVSALRKWINEQLNGDKKP